MKRLCNDECVGGRICYWLCGGVCNTKLDVVTATVCRRNLRCTAIRGNNASELTSKTV